MRSTPRAHKLLLAACLVASATASAAVAERPAGSPPRPFVVESGSRAPENRWLVPDAIEEYAIQVDPATIAANPETLTVDLPDGSELEAVRTRFVVYGPSWKSWSGTLRRAGTKGKGTGYVNFGLHGDQLTAMIHYERERFRIVGGASADGEQRLMRLSEDLSPLSCGSETPELSSQELLLASEASSVGETPLFESVIGPNSARIDVLVVYPRVFFNETAATETSITTFVQQSIQHANDIFANSQVDAWYNLVGIVPLTGAQPGVATADRGLHASLTWMTTSGPSGTAATEVANLRNAFGADVVTMYIPFPWTAGGDFCGVANFPLANGTYVNSHGTTMSAQFDQRAFTSNRLQCGLDDFTLGHEIGHNYGMHHNGTFNTTGWIDPNALGYIFPPSAPTNADVMGCVCTGCACDRTCPLGQGAVCNRIPYFSDPNRTVNGHTIGTASNYATNLARNQVGTYAAYRGQSANTPPNASFTVSCTGRTCTFNASGSTDNSGIASYWWDFGDNTSDSGASVTHPYTNLGTYRVHLVATDNGGQTDVAWGSATAQPIYEGYHEVANCRTISGWAWDQTAPNTSINVNLFRDFTSAGSCAANLYRSDLQAAGKGNGIHGFSCTTPSSFKDGLWHGARVRFAGTSTDLTWTPRNIICQVSMFTNTAAPAENLSNGGVAYTVGTQFSSSQSGEINRLGFHRAVGETGSNTLQLWTDSGAQLASVPTSCSGSGWCWASISPVSISAGTRYRVTVSTNSYQSKTGCGIGSGITNQVLTAHSGYWIAGSGVFPTNGSCSNFYVDVKFDM